jgi:hypothetical protein
MPTATTKLTELEDQIVDVVTKAQEPVLSSVRRAVELVEGVLPDVTIPNADRLPSAKALVDNQYEFASRLLKLNHEFVLAILDTLKPLELKITGDAPKATAKTTAKKAAAKAA